jgi:hypothetical protein
MHAMRSAEPRLPDRSPAGTHGDGITALDNRLGKSFSPNAANSIG